MSLTNSIEAIRTAYFDRVAKIDLDFAIPTSAATRARSRAIDAATEDRDAALAALMAVPTAFEQLAIAEEKVRLQLQMDRENIEEGERALQKARADLNRLHDEAEANATAGAAELEQVMDAVKAAQLENEAAASAEIQKKNVELGSLIEAATHQRDVEVRQIADNVDADRDEMLTKLLAASRVFEDAERTAVGW